MIWILKSLGGAAGTLAQESGRGNTATLLPHDLDHVIHPPSVKRSLCSMDITWSRGNSGQTEAQVESAAHRCRVHRGPTGALPSSALPGSAWKSQFRS